MSLFLLFLLISSAPVCADTFLRLKNDKYDLKLVRETPSVEGGFSNHYFKSPEGPDQWTKMVVVQTYPYVPDPIKAAEHIRQSYIGNFNVVLGKIQTTRKESILPMVMISNTAIEKPFFESNVIRFTNDKDGGTMLIQYIERVPVPQNAKEKDVKKIINNIEKTQPVIIQMLKQLRVSEVSKEITK